MNKSSWESVLQKIYEKSKTDPEKIKRLFRILPHKEDRKYLQMLIRVDKSKQK